jgi:excisionase family DNA binding protein
LSIRSDSRGGGTIDVTAAEAARRIGVSRQAAVQWARSGKLGGAWQTEASREWRIPEESVEQFKRERETAAVASK